MGITILDQHDKEELNKKIDDTKKETAKQIDEAIKNSTGPIDPSRIKDMYYEGETYGEIVPPTMAIDNGQAIMGELYVMGKPITLVLGKTYKVVYNGTEYESVASTINIQSIGECIGLGDVDVLSTGVPAGTYPFVIATADALTNIGASIAVIPLSITRDIELPTIAIYGDKTEIHQIPPKYIKDMYYTEDGGMVEILPESTAENSDQAIMGEFYVMGKPITLEVGKTYKVVYNGTEYESVASVISIPTIGEGIGLGDVDMLSAGSPSGSYPFVIATADALVSMGASIAVLDTHVVARAMPLPTVAIYGNATVVHQIPPKYIKDMYYEEYSGSNEIFPETTISFADEPAPISVDLGLTVGETYTVKWNGVEYTCVAQEFVSPDGPVVGVCIGNLGAVSGGVNTGEPFMVLDPYPEMAVAIGAEGMVAALDGSGRATVSIAQKKSKIHQIPNKYLDLDWLPIYKENSIAAFDCTTDNNTSGGSVVDGMKSVSTGVVSSVLTNLNYNKTVTLDNQTAQAAIVTIVLDGVSYDAYCMHMDNYFIIRFDTDMKPLPFVIYNNISGEKLYFGAVVDGDHTVTISAKEPNKIPEDFLPGETKPATTIIDMDGNTLRLNEKFNISSTSIITEMRNGLRNKNLILTNVSVYDGEQAVTNMNNLVMSNYYENTTTSCASATFNDVNNNNAYILNFVVDNDGAYAYVNAHRISYDTWNGGSY